MHSINQVFRLKIIALFCFPVLNRKNYIIGRTFIDVYRTEQQNLLILLIF